MRFLALFGFLIILLYSVNGFSYGVGYTSFPLMQGNKLLSAEFTGVFNNGSGAGVQTRYTHKLSSRITGDIGLGVSGGERSNRVFLGADLELYPDYMEQPKISLKTTYENSEEFDVRRHNLILTPTVSKGFNFWGQEAFPFVGLPLTLSLDDDSSTYYFGQAVALGITGKLPFEGMQKYSANIEANINIDDTYNSLFLGISHPLE